MILTSKKFMQLLTLGKFSWWYKWPSNKTSE